MPSFGNFAIFPPVVKRAGAGREWKTEHVETESAEVFNSKWDAGRWRFTLAGAQIAAAHINQWDAFVDGNEGQGEPFLFWLKSRRFQLEKELIATGDGAKSRFQITRTRSYEYGPSRPRVEIIRFPWHDYLPLKHPNGTLALPTEYVRVWVDDIELASHEFAVIREGGVLVFAQAPAGGAQIRVSCRYLVLVHGQDFMPTEAEGSAGVWEFGAGAELIQARGEEEELFADLDATL